MVIIPSFEILNDTHLNGIQMYSHSVYTASKTFLTNYYLLQTYAFKFQEIETM